MRISVGLALAAIVLAQSPQVTFAKPRVTAEAVALPTVSAAVPVTATSRPFLGAAATMAKAGYIEEEFFLSGSANTYDWAGKGRNVKVVAGPGKYVTRILVRRPSDPKRFGGNVEVTVLNSKT